MMESTFPTFDRSRLQLLPLSQRQHLLDVSSILPLQHRLEIGSDFVAVADRIAVMDRGRIVQMGTQARTGPHLLSLMEYLKPGPLGKVRFAKAWELSLIHI